jgi:hypothetical protein
VRGAHLFPQGSDIKEFRVYITIMNYFCKSKKKSKNQKNQKNNNTPPHFIFGQALRLIVIAPQLHP